MKLFKVGILGFVLFLVACGSPEIEETMDSEVQDFSATTQDEADFTEADFEGKWSVVDFIFTNCTTVCPPMTRNMVSLQADAKDAGVDQDKIQYVSFSVDPDYDSPEVLQEYIEEHGADTNNWTFLTGYSFDEITDISMESFKSMLAPPEEGDDQVMHGTWFFLVNPDGKIVKNYPGIQPSDMDDILEDLKIVAK